MTTAYKSSSFVHVKGPDSSDRKPCGYTTVTSYIEYITVFSLVKISSYLLLHINVAL